jgi:hypothetical protein
MPSHVTHLLFANDVCNGAGLETLTRPPHECYLVLGAQGPDFFYHNQRRKPSALTYGSLMHRHGYGEAVSHMAFWAWERSLPLESWAGAWVVGFATHAILDRFTHPFINYFSGWVEPGDPHTERYRSMHPFLERLIDVRMLERERGIHPNELGFHSRVTCGDSPPQQWLELQAAGMTGAYSRAANDEALGERLTSAYLDTLGYYRFTDIVDRSYLSEALEREERGEIGTRWLSIVHPPTVPADLDVLNERHTEWCHPCSIRETTTESFVDRYTAAREASITVIRTIIDTWESSDDPAQKRECVENAVGNWNLSDGRPTERACRKRHAGPLPLGELQARIRASIREGNGGRVDSLA